MEANQIKSSLFTPPPSQLDQARLNITERSRSSRLPWRGQFSPELVEYLMEVACSKSTHFYDPFCGSGTVLFEALQRGKEATGLEVNPAAWHLGVLAGFSILPSDEQKYVKSRMRMLVAHHSASNSLFDTPTLSVMDTIKSSSEPLSLKLALAAAIILGMGNGKELNSAALVRGGFAVTSLLSELEGRFAKASCLLQDARHTGVAEHSVDAVITSPPYINVFNYHQNYRPAVELLGWQPLQAATSEIGANRKHRMNRFLTVIQYCLDMQKSLTETARVMRTGAPLVIVLGRTSNVLGTSFQNGQIIRELLASASCFEHHQEAERVFTNRFGERIYEDILVWHRNETKPNLDLEPAREIGISALKRGLCEVPEKNLPALQNAIENAARVQPSSLLEIAVPSMFQEAFEKKA